MLSLLQYRLSLCSRLELDRSSVDRAHRSLLARQSVVSAAEPGRDFTRLPISEGRQLADMQGPADYSRLGLLQRTDGFGWILDLCRAD